MGGLLAALIGILAAFGVMIVLSLHALGAPIRIGFRIATRPMWIGCLALRYFNHPPQVWSAP
ncbi:hypothetical protein [Sphingopyxis sp.]|uniref:hypothetical protein n=1 Tax=Sphingopyxis sp. TaxID=1908224 RepID=UPI002B47B9D0|nr:hypothetical protein [Sphingopyxis sp.]